VVLDCSSSLGISYNDTAQGVYSLNIDIDSASIGAVVIKFLGSTNQAQGIRAIYNGITYNEVSRASSGYFAATSPSDFTFLQGSFPTCTVAGLTFPSVPSFYCDGSVFQPTGSIQSISVASGDVGVVSTMAFVMVVPKITNLPDVLKYQIASLCGTTSSFQLMVECPRLLTGFQITSVRPNAIDICTIPLVSIGYNVPIIDTDIYGLPNINHWVFSDPYGQFVLTDGYYGFLQPNSLRGFFRCENGVVTEIASCN